MIKNGESGTPCDDQKQLTDTDLQEVNTIIHKGISGARIITRARTLKAAHEKKLDREVCSALGIVRSTVHDTRKHYVEGGLKRALYELPRPGKARKLSGVQEAKVIAIACTEPPEGYNRWTLDLLTEETHKQLSVSIGRTAIWKVCLRNEIKPWREKNVGDFRDYA